LSKPLSEVTPPRGAEGGQPSWRRPWTRCAAVATPHKQRGQCIFSSAIEQADGARAAVHFLYDDGAEGHGMVSSHAVGALRVEPLLSHEPRSVVGVGSGSAAIIGAVSVRLGVAPVAVLRLWVVEGVIDARADALLGLCGIDCLQAHRQPPIAGAPAALFVRGRKAATMRAASKASAAAAVATDLAGARRRDAKRATRARRQQRRARRSRDQQLLEQTIAAVTAGDATSPRVAVPTPDTPPVAECRPAAPPVAESAPSAAAVAALARDAIEAVLAARDARVAAAAAVLASPAQRRADMRSAPWSELAEDIGAGAARASAEATMAAAPGAPSAAQAAAVTTDEGIARAAVCTRAVDIAPFARKPVQVDMNSNGHRILLPHPSSTWAAPCAAMQTGDSVEVVNLTASTITMAAGTVLGSSHPMQEEAAPLAGGAKASRRRRRRRRGEAAAAATAARERVVLPRCPAHSDAQHAELQQLVDKFPFVTTELGVAKGVEHVVTMRDSVPVVTRPWRRSMVEEAALRDEVAKLNALGVVKKQFSRYCSPMLLVKKPSGGWRLCLDCRKINEKSVRQPHVAIPTVEASLAALSGSCIFSSLDANAGYHQIPLAEASQEFTGFVVDGESYVYTRTSMGLRDSAATYTRMMAAILNHIPHAHAYIDDVIIHSATWREHMRDLEAVFAVMQDSGMTCSPKKMVLARSELRFLGHVVCPDGIRADPAFVEPLRASPPPSTKAEATRLLGQLGWLRKFVPGFADRIAPIQACASVGRWRKDTWTPEAEAARRSILDRVERFVTLHHPDMNGEFVVDVDTSRTACGAILTQLREDEDGTMYRVPIAFASRRLNEAEQAYSATELEGLGCAFACRRFRPWLHGKVFTLRCDHSALEHVSSNPEKNWRLARYCSVMAEFDYKPVHVPKDQMQHVDYISRSPGGPCTVLEDALGRSADEIHKGYETVAVAACVLGAPAPTDPAAFAAAQDADPLWRACKSAVVRRAQGQLEPGGAEGTHDRWAQHMLDRLSVDQWNVLRVAEPGHSTTGRTPPAALPHSLRVRTVVAFHDEPGSGGHTGARATELKVRQWYFWPTLTRDVADYVASCSQCAGRRPLRDANAVAANAVDVPPYMFHTFQMDTVGPFKHTGSSATVFVITAVEVLTKHLSVHVVPHTPKAADGARALQRLTHQYGRPALVVTDGGPEFKKEFRALMAEAAAGERITHRVGTAEHHLGRATLERLHRVLWSRVALQLPATVEDWTPVIELAAFAYNATPAGQDAVSPFEAVHGQAPQQSATLWSPLATSDRTAEVPSAAARRAMQTRARNAARTDGAHRPLPVFAPGEEVMAFKQVPARDPRADPDKAYPATSGKLLSHLQFAYVLEKLRRAPGEGTQGDSYRLRFYDTGKEVTRHAAYMHKRVDRAAFLKTMGVSDPLGRRASPGEDAARPAAALPPRRRVPMPRAAPTRIVLAIPTDPRDRRTRREPWSAIPVAATVVSRSADGTATVRIDGVHGPTDQPRQVTLPGNAYTGTVQSAAAYRREWTAGQWASLTEEGAAPALRRVAWRNATCDSIGMERTQFLCDLHLRDNAQSRWVRAEEMDREFPLEAAKAVKQFIALAECVD
jgi:hypothetical protein